ncbi:fimbria/pilus outer membrane usher protein [Yersinia frederiksenii]|uniref:fimbria/pilus outer membrane usher protein n=1 Tax=Yersinia frederiksenii TaxID=29484 RepID=UPI0025AAB5E8|nr:fimbria/pilus outer membrane usher protein [Yersinia frederiksenii]MDN0120121.1 fimbria/pilus outer membrane usher protein [Yersinia frederiksenii]
MCLLSLFPVMAVSATKKGAAAFDIKTLEGLGYSADLAEFFSKQDKFLPGQHDVTLIINANKTYRTEASFNSEGQLCADRKLLMTLKLHHKDSDDSCENIETLWPGVAVKLFPGQFRIEMTLPQEAFDPELESSDYQRGGYAVLLNYNLFGQRIESNNDDLNLFQGQFEPGINFNNWVLRNRGSYTYNQGIGHYDNQETYALRAVESLKSVVQLGEFGLVGNTYSGLPVVGAQLYSDNAQLNNTQLTVPIEGIANTNATIEIRQRGRVIYRTVVAPGPFSLSNISNFSSGVPTDVNVIEEDGTQQNFTVSNALDPNFEQQATTYQLAIGRYRDNLDNGESDSPLLASGEWSFSPINSLRTTSAGLLSADYQNISMQNLYSGLENAWFSGVASYSNTKSAGQGYQLSVQNQVAINGNLSASLSTVYDSVNYWSPDNALSNGNNLETLTNGKLKNATSAALTWAHPRWGAFSYVLSNNMYYQAENSVSHTVSVSEQFGRVTTTLSIQSTSQGQNAAYFGLSMPLGKGSLSGRMQRNNGNMTLGSTYQGTWDDNKGYSVGITGSDNQRRVNGAMNIKTAYSQLSGGVSQAANNSRSAYLSSSGSMAYANNTFATSASAIGDTFAVVNVPSQSNLRVSSPSSGMAITDYAGTALLPSVIPYTVSKAQISTKTLPLNIRLNSTSADLMMTRGTVATRDFEATETRQLLLTILDSNREPMPVGANVLDTQGKFLGTIIGDGNFMLENKTIGAMLRVKATNRGECVVSYVEPEKFDPDTLYEVVDAVCH